MCTEMLDYSCERHCKVKQSLTSPPMVGDHKSCQQNFEKMAPKLPVSDDEDFELEDFEMVSESSESNAEGVSDEEFLVEVRFLKGF